MKKFLVALICVVWAVSCRSEPDAFDHPQHGVRLAYQAASANFEEQLFPVTLTLDVPATIRPGELVLVTLQLDPIAPVAAGDVEIAVTSSVGADLMSSSLRVLDHSPYRQVIASHRPTTWQWTIQSTGARPQDLTVSVVAFVVSDEFSNGPVEFQLETYRRTITVLAPWHHATLEWWQTNWQWSFSTLVLPFGIWMWARRKPKAPLQK